MGETSLRLRPLEVASAVVRSAGAGRGLGVMSFVSLGTLADQHGVAVRVGATAPRL